MISQPKDFFNDLEAYSKKIIDQTIAYAKNKSEEIIEETNKNIQKQISPRTIEVRVNDLPKKVLKTIPVPYLSRLIVNAKLGLHSLLIGPAGSGKTIAASQVSETLELPFGHLCFTAGASETWLFGRQTPNGFIEGIFSTLYREGGVFLADEMDAADPNLLLSINTALSSDSFLNPISGVEIRKHKNFVFIGACNTFGKGGNHIYTGRNRLDAATLDRFISIEVNYNPEIEASVCPDVFLRSTLQGTRDELIKNGMEEVVSTRSLLNAYLQFESGVPTEEIFKSISLSWTSDAKLFLEKNKNIQSGSTAVALSKKKRA